MRGNCTQILAWDVGVWSWEFDFEREGYYSRIGRDISFYVCAI